MKKILFLAALLGTAASAMAQKTVTKMVVRNTDGTEYKVAVGDVKEIVFVEEDAAVVPTTAEEAIAMMQGQWKADVDPSMLPPYADEMYMEIDGDYLISFIHVPDGCTDETYGAYAGQYVIMNRESGWSDEIVPDAADPTKGEFGGGTYENLNSESFVRDGTVTFRRVETPLTYVDPSATPSDVFDVEIDGVKKEITEISVEKTGTQGFSIFMFGDDEALVAEVDIALNYADGNSYNLTDNLEGLYWVTGIIFGEVPYWTDKSDFTSGTIKVSVSDVDTETGTCTLNVETSGVANDADSDSDADVSFSISLSGKAKYSVIGSGSKQRKN